MRFGWIVDASRQADCSQGRFVEAADMPLAVVHLACDFLYGQTVYVPVFQHQLGFRIGETADGVVDGPSQAQKPVHFLGNPRLPKEDVLPGARSVGMKLCWVSMARAGERRLGGTRNWMSAR